MFAKRAKNGRSPAVRMKMHPRAGRTADPNAEGGGRADPKGQKADNTRVHLGRHIGVALNPPPNACADAPITDP